MERSFSEKRLRPRSRVFYGGDIIIDRDLSTVECHVKNLSDGGAKIVVLSGDLLPDRFDLIIRKTGKRHHAVVTWSHRREYGVAYRAHDFDRREFASSQALRKTFGLSIPSSR